LPVATRAVVEAKRFLEWSRKVRSGLLRAVLERAAGLTPGDLQAVAELERQVAKADGGRLKLEWDSLRSRSGDRVEDLLWWEDERLLGFLGIYTFGESPELAGMVAPDARRRGIGTALLDAGLPLCRERGDRPPLLVVPRQSTAGKRLAQRRGGTLDHSEHHLVLVGEPSSGPRQPEIRLRPATGPDAPLVVSLLEHGFGWSGPADLTDRLKRTALVELDGAVVGTLFLERDDDEEASIFGFVIEPSLQGRGIGRAALHQACEQLRADGARRISLDVDVANDRALGLYTSIGFTPVTTEDYFALPLR
jgi:ribosomal protein S18 acetylase RimI-like enzyme